MKSILAAAALVIPALSAQAGVDVGVSIGISQPGVYGRVDIGRYPVPPQVVYTQPVYVEPPPRVVVAPPPPQYLWVPYGHRKNWSRNCYRYGACGAPVYFVQDGWYRRNVMVGQPYPVEPGWHEHGRRYQRSHRHWDD